MNISRKRVVAALALLAAAGAAVLLSLGAAAYKRRGEVQQALEKLLGNDASFAVVEGSLWGRIGFTVKQFRIADDPKFAATPFVQARELRMGISLWHLVRGRLVIDSLTFIAPEFQIITNEDGILNVSALASRKELTEFARLRLGSTQRKKSPLNFLITRLKVIDGRVDFIDRSMAAPAQLRVKNIDLDLGGLDLAARAKIKLAASLTEGLGPDLRVEGEIGPPARGRSWSQQPVNLEMRFDSLSLPTLARAVPFLRDRVPRELDITGPMYFRAKLSGTLQQPRFTGITLKVPFLGSSEYNAILEGRAEFDQSRKWSDAPIAGTLALNDISLSQFQRLPLLRQALPDDFAADGAVNIRTSFEGTWNHLRAGILLEAKRGEFRIPGWAQKPAGIPAELRAQISRHENGFVVHPSALNLGGTKVLLSGALTQTQAARLLLRIRADKTSLKSLGRFLAPEAFDGFAGDIDWDLALERNIGTPDGGWEARGFVHLRRAGLRHKASDKKVNNLNASLSFLGNRARVKDLSFRLGSSTISATLDIVDLNGLSGHYTLRSPDLNLRDVPLHTGVGAARLKEVAASGAIAFSDQLRRLEGTLSSPEGTFHEIAYRSLRTDITWSPAGLSFKELRAEVFNGEMRAGGGWNLGPGQEPGVRVAATLVGLSVNELVKRFAPDLKDRLDGQLDFRGEFTAAALAGEALRETLKGSGTALIRDGTIRDFNLLARLFYRRRADEPGAGLEPGTAASYAAVLQREHTPLRDFKTSVAVEARRLRADSLVLSTPEYEITGAGWIDMDGATRWKGLLTFSPRVSRELRREYGAIRYFVDRKGRLAISFRVDGQLPHITIRPENRALGRVFRWGTWQRGDDAPAREQQNGKNWLSKSLDRLLQANSSP